MFQNKKRLSKVFNKYKRDKIKNNQPKTSFQPTEDLEFISDGPYVNSVESILTVDEVGAPTPITLSNKSTNRNNATAKKGEKESTKKYQYKKKIIITLLTTILIALIAFPFFWSTILDHKENVETPGKTKLLEAKKSIK